MSDTYAAYLKRHPPKLYNRVSWNQFFPYFRRTWLQGEHITIVGPTGCGKSTLESQILTIREYIVIFVTKVYDEVLTYQFPEYHRISKWPPKYHQDKVLLWPKPGKDIRETYLIQRNVFKDALNKIFQERNWTVVFDEQHYMVKKLALGPENEMFLHQGRSSGLSVVNGTQRPAWVPVVTYSSATHAFIWNTNYHDDLRRLSDLGGISSKDLSYNIQTLSKHEFIYVNCRTGDVMRSQVGR
jgi:hypothetical protein